MVVSESAGPYRMSQIVGRLSNFLDTDVIHLRQPVLDVLSLSTGWTTRNRRPLPALLPIQTKTLNSCPLHLGYNFSMQPNCSCLPELSPNRVHRSRTCGTRILNVEYGSPSQRPCPFETSILLLCYSDDLCLAHCIAHLDEEGDPVGFTLERASERVLPLLLVERMFANSSESGNCLLQHRYIPWNQGWRRSAKALMPSWKSRVRDTCANASVSASSCSSRFESQDRL